MGFEKSEKSENGIRTLRSNSSFTLSLSQLKGSKEQYIDQLKKDQVQVLSEKENSLVTVRKVNDIRQRNILDRQTELLEKTLIVDDVVLQIQKSANLVFPLSKFFGSTETLVKLLDKIQVAPKVPTVKA